MPLTSTRMASRRRPTATTSTRSCIRAQDLPDVEFEDTDCDGIDGTAARAIFVAPAGDDGATGTMGNPVHSMQVAVNLAKDAGKDVYAAGGSYVGTVSVASGVGIYGGYTPLSGARSSSEVTTIKGVGDAVVADGVSGVVLQLVTLTATPAGAGGSTYGLRALNSKLALRAVTSAPAAGAAGADPAQPGRRPQANPGAVGASGGWRAPACLRPRPVRTATARRDWRYCRHTRI